MMVYFEGTWAGCEVFEKYVSILDNPPDDEVHTELLRNIWAELKSYYASKLRVMNWALKICWKTYLCDCWIQLTFVSKEFSWPLCSVDLADLCVCWNHWILCLLNSLTFVSAGFADHCVCWISWLVSVGFSEPFLPIEFTNLHMKKWQ